MKKIYYFLDNVHSNKYSFIANYIITSSMMLLKLMILT